LNKMRLSVADFAGDTLWSCPEMWEPKHILKHPSALKSIETGDKGGPIDWFPARFLRNQKLNSSH
jgi:hypothetical protein